MIGSGAAFDVATDVTRLAVQSPAPGRAGAGLGVCIYQRYLPPDASGAGKQAVTLARALRRRGVDVVLLGDANSDSTLPPCLDGVPVRWVRTRKRGYYALVAYWLRVGLQLLRLQRRFDVLHIHSAAFDQAGAILIARVLGKRVLVRSSLQGEFAGLSKSRSGRLHRRWLQFCHRFVVLSRELAAEFAAAELPLDRLERISNGVDTSLFHPVDQPAKQRLREELDLPLHARIVVFHGVFIERKRLCWLVEHLGPVLKERNLVLLLVGGAARDEPETGYAQRLTEIIARSPARERILIRPATPEVHRYLQAADLYILASNAEGMPNALLEAMATGLVPIVNRSSGANDVVQDGENGLFFDVGNPPTLHSALERCHADRDLARLSEGALARIGERFDIDVVADRFVAMYESMTSRTRRA